MGVHSVKQKHHILFATVLWYMYLCRGETFSALIAIPLAACL